MVLALRKEIVTKEILPPLKVESERSWAFVKVPLPAPNPSVLVQRRNFAKYRILFSRILKSN